MKGCSKNRGQLVQFYVFVCRGFLRTFRMALAVVLFEYFLLVKWAFKSSVEHILFILWNIFIFILIYLFIYFLSNIIRVMIFYFFFKVI